MIISRPATIGLLEIRSNPQVHRAVGMLSFETAENDGVLVVRFEEIGDPHSEQQASERQSLYQLIEVRSDPRYAFDLGAIKYLTSSDIGFLITLRRRIAAHKGRVILFAVDPYLVDILRTMKLHQLFEFSDNLAGAVALFSTPSPQ